MADPVVLDSAATYYSAVLKPQYDEFLNNPSTFRTAINLALSLFHFHEWLYEDYRGKLKSHFNTPLLTKGAFWGKVEAEDQRFGFIRDVANASKHVRLTQRPSTSMTHMANTSIQIAAWDEAQWDEAKWETPSVTMKEGSRDVLFDPCAEALFEYWTNLLNSVK